MKKFKNYYNINFLGVSEKGKRDPMRRINKIPINFKNKSVLDLGCNSGWMLFSISNLISYGVGFDGDGDEIQKANKIKKELKLNNLDFFVMDFENDVLSFPKTDIVFMLSIAYWVKNWKELIKITQPQVLVFEAHGSSKKRKEQIDYLNNIFKKVRYLLSEEEGKAFRDLVLCEGYNNVK